MVEDPRTLGVGGVVELEAAIEAVTVDDIGAHPPAHGVRGFENCDLHTVSVEVASGGEPAQPCAHDDGNHACTGVAGALLRRTGRYGGAMTEVSPKFADAATIETPPRLQQWEARAEWPLAAVATIFLAVYSVQVLANPQGRADNALEAVLLITWAVFAIDYLARLILAIDRWRWFRRHLIDLAVVSLPFLRPLRLLRLLVLFGALQKAVGGAIRGRVVIYAAFSAVLLIYVASLAILDEERGVPGSTINSFGDAVWWSITTVTTVGYGDLSPTTPRGKIIAVFLMLGGISLVGMITATLASWIIHQVAREDTANQAATAAQIEALRNDMEKRIDSLSSEVRRLTEDAEADPFRWREDPARRTSSIIPKNTL